jgi:hypothetical protein
MPTRNANKEKLVNLSVLRYYSLVIVDKLKWLLFIITLALVLLGVNRFFLDSGKVDHNLIIQYLSALKWPIGIIVAGIVFRPFLPGLADRLTELPGGIKFSPKQQEEISEKGEEELNAATQASPSVDISTESGRAAVLEDFEAKWLLEKAYRSIYGTQVEALLLLNGYPSGLGEAELNNIFSKHRTLTTSPYEDVVSFMRYLTNYKFVDFDPVNKIFKITDLGRLFIDYLRQENLMNSMLRHY